MCCFIIIFYLGCREYEPGCRSGQKASATIRFDTTGLPSVMLRRHFLLVEFGKIPTCENFCA